MKTGVIKIKRADIEACSEVEIFVPEDPSLTQSGFLNEINLDFHLDLILSWDCNETFDLLPGMKYPDHWFNLKDFFQYLSFRDPVRKDIADQDAITWYRHWSAKSKFWPHLEREIAHQISLMEDHGLHLDLTTLEQNIRLLQKGEWESKNKGIKFEDEYSLQILKQIDTRRRGDTLPTSIRYYGSFTGRASGSIDSEDKLNLLALPKTDWVHKTIIPRSGKRFLILDMDQFEPRIVAWDTKDEFMLQRLREGFNPYEADAERELGNHFKPNTLKETNPETYSYYKGRRNSLNYGCGWKTYAEKAREYGQEINEGHARETVRQFRFHNPNLTDAWKYYDNMLVHHNHVGAMPVALPSGRIIYYWNIKDKALETRPDGDAPHKNPVRTKYYGPKIFENRIQGIARDIHSELCVILEQHHYPIVHHVFDSIYLEVPVDISEHEINNIKGIAEIPPKWAPDLPLSCSVKLSDHYA